MLPHCGGRATRNHGIRRAVCEQHKYGSVRGGSGNGVAYSTQEPTSWHNVFYAKARKQPDPDQDPEP